MTPPTPAGRLAPVVERLRGAVAQQAGLDFTGVRAESLEQALAHAARIAGASDPEAHARALLEGTASLPEFVEGLTIGETWLFRDPAQWRFVEDVVVPDALARRLGARERFRAWSAGCSTGEEPYTLAIVLDELGLREGLHLVATDLNEAALARARAAELSLWSLRGAVDARARRHLTERGGVLHLDREIAARVRFFGLNLAGPDYPSPSRGLADLDLVLCRNVLIYLERARIPGITRRLFETLAPGGWLVAGPADPVLSEHAPFTVRAGPFGVAYQRPAGAPARGLRRAPADVLGAVARSGPLPRAAGSAHRRSEPRARRARAQPPVAPAAAAPGSADPELFAARTLVDGGRLGEALEAVDAALRRAPLDPEAHFERAVVLTEVGRLDDAEEACRRALYLARGQPFVHYFLAMLRLRRGDERGAGRAFRTAAALAARRDPAEGVPLSHGMTAGALAEAAGFHLSRIEGGGRTPPRR